MVRKPNRCRITIRWRVQFRAPSWSALAWLTIVLVLVNGGDVVIQLTR